MAMLRSLNRVWTAISPPIVEKREEALHFGLLGASAIAPIALIGPAKSHPEVVVWAVAARDRKKAETYAKKHKIPTVYSTYQEILDDPKVSCVYIALPNSHHYEWALKALQARKHVLLEKPSVSNEDEAERLFKHGLTTAPDAPVLLEAFHNRFHPAYQKFLQYIHNDPLAGPIERVSTEQYVPRGFAPPHDIRFQYDLAGGAMMDFGTYALQNLRQVTRESLTPTEVTYRQYKPPAKLKVATDYSQIDEAITAKYKAEGSDASVALHVDFGSTGGFPSFLPESWTKNIPSLGWPKCTVELGKKQVEGENTVTAATDQSHTVQRTITFWNHIMPFLYHRIDIVDAHEVRKTSDGSLVKQWKEKSLVKEYKWSSKQSLPGEAWWSTYRYQLEEFVNKIKGRSGSGVWVSHEDSIEQMKTIDSTYEKAGLKLRPSSAFNI